MSVLQHYPLVACPGCHREGNLPSPQMTVPSLHSVPSSNGGRRIPNLRRNILGPNFISRHLAMSLSPSSSVRGQKVMSILLLSAQRPANFYSSVYSASPPNGSFTSPKGKKSFEDIVPKKDKGFNFSSYVFKSLFTSEAPEVTVALNAIPL